MKASVLSLVFLSGLAAAQIPSCATGCVTKFTTGTSIAGCEQLDIACICKNADFLSGIACCLASTCDAASQAQAVQYAKQICSSAGVTTPDQVVCNESSSSSSSSESESSTESSTKSATKSTKSTTAADTSASTATTDSSDSSTTGSSDSSTTATDSSSAPATTSSASRTTATTGSSQTTSSASHTSSNVAAPLASAGSLIGAALAVLAAAL